MEADPPGPVETVAARLALARPPACAAILSSGSGATPKAYRRVFHG
jgi:hypothetical protein